MNEPTARREPFSKGTKVIFALVALFCVLIMGGSLSFNYFQAVQNNKVQAQEIGSQNATSRLLRQYCNAVNSYNSTTGKIYSGETCDQATQSAQTIANAGAQGPQGPTGRGIQAIVCEPNGQLKVMYTDNTWSTITGSKCN